MDAGRKMMMCCTCGRGMGLFVRKELKGIGADFCHSPPSELIGKRKQSSQPGPIIITDNSMGPAVEEVASTEGKIFFTVPESVSSAQLLSLRTVERVFIVAFRSKSPHLTDDQIITATSRNKDLIGNALLTWNRLFRHQQRLKSYSRTYINHRKRKLSEPTADIQSQKLTEESVDEKSATVRISVKITGEAQKSISQDEVRASVCERIGGTIHGQSMVVTGDAETTLNIIYSENLLLVGVPISCEPLSTRSYIKSHGLRPTTCAAMIQLAEIKSSDVILDPFCGAATILIEAVNQQPAAHYIGIDDKMVQLQQACENVEHYSQVSNQKVLNVQLMLGNAKNIPVRDRSVDVILTDLPFGKKHRAKQLHHLYTHCCQQLYRVLTVGGCAVILTSKAMLNHLKEAAITERFTVVSEHFITLGRTEAYIIKLQK